MTSFIVQSGKHFDIRWFTPRNEINLCGHGSVGAGAALLSKYSLDQVLLHSPHGNVLIRQRSDLYSIEMPSWDGVSALIPKALSAMVSEPVDYFTTRDQVIVLQSVDAVIKFQSEDDTLRQMKDYHALIVTAQDGPSGYALRYFAPNIGISEDRATGSAQCSLAPYWFRKLGVNALSVRQLSSAGGYFEVEKKSDDKITIYAHAELRRALEKVGV